MRRVVVDIDVVTGDRPYLPLLEVPSKVCISEMDLLPLDMMRIEGRYREDERVILSLVALKGRLVLEQSRICELCEFGPAASVELVQGSFHDCLLHKSLVNLRLIFQA